jgi:transcriptional regulator with XRE-family HTH domain
MLIAVDPFYEDFGARVRAARGHRLSQTQLARKVGLSRGSIANIETGRQHVPLHMILVLARELAVDPTSLLPTSLGEHTDLVPPERLNNLHSLDVSSLERVVRRARQERVATDGQA